MTIPRHLHVDVAPLAACNRCGRRSWAPGSVGTICGMTQPDASRCEGTLQPAGAAGWDELLSAWTGRSR